MRGADTLREKSSASSTRRWEWWALVKRKALTIKRSVPEAYGISSGEMVFMSVR